MIQSAIFNVSEWHQQINNPLLLRFQHRYQNKHTYPDFPAKISHSVIELRHNLAPWAPLVTSPLIGWYSHVVSIMHDQAWRKPVTAETCGQRSFTTAYGPT